MTSQFLLKTGQDIELFNGYEQFNQINTNNDKSIISSVLSSCGRFLAVSNKVNVQIFTGEQFNTSLITLPLVDAYDLCFSPSGNFLSTWQRPKFDIENDQNVKIWYLNRDFSNLEENSIIEPVHTYHYNSQNSWSLQFSKLDNYVIKLIGKDLKIIKLDLSNLDKPVEKFDFENSFATLSSTTNDNQNFKNFSISPAEFPTICTFTPEKSGKPAQLTIWPITQGKITKKIVTKSFFKADSCQLKWNQQGNAILGLAITDFDSQNKSYYGENTLYLLSFQGVNGTLGGNSVRLPLTTGPVHDFTWSPTSRQFGVIAGYMPATVAFFDLRGNIVHSLPKQSKNTLIFSPTGKFILIGGFGNLQGSVEILDRHNKFKSITKFDATNTSVCKWSPGGEFIMTATTSPRLRVDNCIKIWHFTGTLVFVKEFKELLKVDWRLPCPFRLVNPDSHLIKDWTIINSINDETKNNLDPKLVKNQLKIDESATEFLAKKKAAALNNTNQNGSSKSAGATKTGGAYKPPHARRAAAIAGNVPGMTNRTVPGAAAVKPSNDNNNKSRRKKNNTNSNNNNIPPIKTPVVQQQQQPAVVISPEEKKIRSLLKKLRSIEVLKQRQIDGDKLEDTQVLKIQTEDKVLRDLKALGWKEEDDE